MIITLQSCSKYSVDNHGDGHEDYHLVECDVTPCSLERIYWVSYEPAASIFLVET
jgi:hypothetical protein